MVLSTLRGLLKVIFLMGKEVVLMDDAVPLFFVVAPMIVDDDVLVISCLDVSLLCRQLEFVG